VKTEELATDKMQSTPQVPAWLAGTILKPSLTVGLLLGLLDHPQLTISALPICRYWLPICKVACSAVNRVVGCAFRILNL
jgi:hypothetical protein